MKLWQLSIQGVLCHWCQNYFKGCFIVKVSQLLWQGVYSKGVKINITGCCFLPHYWTGWHTLVWPAPPLQIHWRSGTSLSVNKNTKSFSQSCKNICEIIRIQYDITWQHSWPMFVWPHNSWHQDQGIFSFIITIYHQSPEAPDIKHTAPPPSLPNYVVKVADGIICNNWVIIT